MNKTSKILFVAIFLFALTFVGFADAAKPKPPNTLPDQMVYWTSNDPTLKDVGVSNGAYELKLDGNPNTWYYLNVTSMGVAPSNGYYLFSIEPVSDTENPLFWDYWETKGVNPNMLSGDKPTVFTWQHMMAAIITGFSESAMFILRVEDGNYMLIDGLQFFYYYYANQWAGNTIGLGDVPQYPLRLGGDYPEGSYTFTCTVYFDLDWVVMYGGSTPSYTLQIVNSCELTQPKAYDVCLVYWTETDATRFDVAYAKKTYRLTPDGNPSSWYYLDADAISPTPLNGYYFFNLIPPSTENTAFWDYWAAKGVGPVTGGEPWQPIMYGILSGEYPMFVLKVDDEGSVLIDGLGFVMYVFASGGPPIDPNTIPESPLRLNGDYPAGTYTFVGTTGYVPFTWYYYQTPNLYLNGFDGYKVTLQIKQGI